MAIKGNITTLAKLDGPEDQRRQIFKDLGNLEQYQLLDDDVVVAIYAESNVLAAGKRADGSVYQLVGTDNRTTESRYQGKVGVLVVKGPTAFKFYNNGQPYEGITPDIGDWVVFWPSDGRELFLSDLDTKDHNVTCRKFHWASIKMRVSDPRIVY